MATILIVDDSKSVRQQLRVILESDGHSVVEAEDGLDGIDKAALSRFALIITDVNMPKMTGIEMIREVRRLAHHGKTPIFVLTTEGTPDVARSGREAGANAWIVKPFNAPKLLEAVTVACAKSR
jgi:two-component system, chemotaxis family, chemotaxis protein CheY